MSELRRISVRVESASYEVLTGPGALQQLAAEVARLGNYSAIGLLTDQHIWPHWGEQVKASLASLGAPLTVHLLPPGEEYKTLAEYGRALEFFLSAGLDRGSLLVNLGGGVVGDLGGFVAATLMRGLDFVQCPTTLLAQVDASVGGKVAIDHAGGKNLVGVFAQPRLVVADTLTLATLPARQLSNGLAEVVKYGLIEDFSLFELLENQAEAALAGDPELLEELVYRSIVIKARIVAEDERDFGVRQLLNFGHTFAHGLEAALDYSGLLHGEAVGLGMLMAATYAEFEGTGPAGLADRLAGLLRKLRLPTEVTGLSKQAMLGKMAKDKKRLGSELKLVLPTGLGQSEVRTGADPVLLEKVLDRYLPE